MDFLRPRYGTISFLRSSAPILSALPHFCIDKLSLTKTRVNHSTAVNRFLQILCLLLGLYLVHQAKAIAAIPPHDRRSLAAPSL